MSDFSIKTAPFKECPITGISESKTNQFEIHSNDQVISLEQYCTCLLQKLNTLTNSKIKPFMQYQLKLMQDSFCWLNKFEKLLRINKKYFNNEEAVARFEKTLIVIEVLRCEVEKQNDISCKHDFKQVKSKLKEYPTAGEQLEYLYEAEADYLQNKPTNVDRNQVPFDKQVQIEIEKIQRVLEARALTDKHLVSQVEKKATNSIQPKLQLACNTNYFVDIFFQLLHERKMLLGSSKDISTVICSHFLDKDGHPISPETIKTILNPSNIDKRPKGHSKFTLG